MNGYAQTAHDYKRDLDLTVLEKRQLMLANGYSPLPLNGKRPIECAWQNLPDPTLDQIAQWYWPNTGLRTRYCPALDIDLTDQAAAEGVSKFVGERVRGHGILPVRVGRAPKRLRLFRADVPFPKMLAKFRDRNGTEHRIEFLADGQQLVADGIHPDMHQPYVWLMGAPWETPRSDLVAINEAGARDLLHEIEQYLIREHGFRRTGDTADFSRRLSTRGREQGRFPATWKLVWTARQRGRG